MVAYYSGNPFEAGVAVKHTDVVLVGDGFDGFGGDDGLDDVFVAGETSEFGVAGHDVVEKNHDNLVAVDEHVLAIVVTQYATDTVGVGVGCHNEVGTYFLGFGNSHRHS